MIVWRSKLDNKDRRRDIFLHACYYKSSREKIDEWMNEQN